MYVEGFCIARKSLTPLLSNYNLVKYYLLFQVTEISFDLTDSWDFKHSKENSLKLNYV